MTGTKSHSKVGTTGTSEGVRPDLDIQRARSPTVQGTHAQQNERFTPLQRDNLMTRPNPDTQGTAPTTAQGVQPQLMPGLDSFLHIQRARSPTVQGTHAQQNEKFTPLQRDNPMTRSNPGTQGTAPTTPDAPAQQNERITQPQKENLMPGPDSGTQGSTPPQRKDPIPRPDPHIQRPAPPLSRVPPPTRMRDSHNPREKTRCQDQNQAPRE